jgi:hypothetical protein
MDNQLAAVVERDIFLAAEKPRARTVYESLERMKSKEEIKQKLMRLEEELIAKYMDKKK